MSLVPETPKQLTPESSPEEVLSYFVNSVEDGFQTSEPFPAFAKSTGKNLEYDLGLLIDRPGIGYTYAVMPADSGFQSPLVVTGFGLTSPTTAILYEDNGVVLEHYFYPNFKLPSVSGKNIAQYLISEIGDQEATRVTPMSAFTRKNYVAPWKLVFNAKDELRNNAYSGFNGKGYTYVMLQQGRHITDCPLIALSFNSFESPSGACYVNTIFKVGLGMTINMMPRYLVERGHMRRQEDSDIKIEAIVSHALEFLEQVFPDPSMVFPVEEQESD